jgi:SHS2 domain-containing protein
MLESTETRSVSVSHRILSHTADMGIEASGDDLPGLVVELATGMFESMGALVAGSSKEGVPIEVEIHASTPEQTVVDALSELLYESEVRDLFLCDFHARSLEPKGLGVIARGVSLAWVEPAGPPIKAVTYHDLLVEETDDAWHGRVYFDV